MKLLIDYIKRRHIEILVFLIAGLLSLTHFYSIGFILVCLYFAGKKSSLRVFSTSLSKFIFSLLMLLATIILIGLAVWLSNAPLHPAYVLIPYIALMTLLTKRHEGTSKKARGALLDKSDLYSVSASLAIPLLIFLSYFIPHYSDAALYQLLSNGWDNSSHVSMIETTSLQKGYAYAKESDNPYDNFSNAYPQAWHLASSFFASGFGFNPFNPDSPLTVLRSYALTITAWLVLSGYLLAKNSLSIYSRYLKRGGDKESSLISYVPLVGGVLVVQLMSTTGAFFLGFANFIGLMTFMLLFASIVMDIHKDKKTNRGPHIIAAAVACSAASMCWFLLLPALFASFVLYIWHVVIDGNKLKFVKNNILPLTISVIVLMCALIQVIIFLRYSSTAGTDQLNAGGGAYENSGLLLLVMLFASAAAAKLGSTEYIKRLVVLLTPCVGLVFIIFLYQTLLLGETSYYFYKTLDASTLYIGMFFIASLLLLSNTLYKKLHGSAPLTALAITASLCVLVVGTNQTITPWYRIVQRNSVVSYTAAEAMVNYLKKNDPHTTKIITLTSRSNEPGPKKNDVFNGDLVTRVSHLKPTCVFYVVNSYESRAFSARLRRLSKCADETNDTILVITNSVTREAVAKLGKKNIDIITIK